MGAKVKIPIPGGFLEGEIVQFQERESGGWLEYYLPDEKKWLRVKPTLVRVVKADIPSRSGDPVSYFISTENVIDVVPE